jgi:hypothetical protein
MHNILYQSGAFGRLPEESACFTHAVRECFQHTLGSAYPAIHFQRSCGRQCEFRRHVVTDVGHSNDLDLQHLARCLRSLEFIPVADNDANGESLSRDRLLDGISVRVEKILNRRADEIGAVGIKTLGPLAGRPFRAPLRSYWT